MADTIDIPIPPRFIGFVKLARSIAAEKASSTHGVFTRRKALAAGVSAHQIDHDVTTGRFIVLYPGVYVHAGAPQTLHMHQVAACKWAGQRAALSHRSALAEFGVGGVWAEFIELTTVGRRCHHAPVIVHRTDYLPDHHIVRRNGRRFTDVPRALFDAGAVLPQRVVAAAVNDAISRKLTTSRALYARLLEHGGRGRRGCGVLRRVLEERDPLADKTESMLEILMLENVWSGALPRPVAQFPIRVAGRNLRLDFAYPPIKLDIEADGRRDHGGDDAFDNDRERDAELGALGWQVLRFTWRHVRDKPEWVVARIAEVHAQRSALFGN